MKKKIAFYIESMAVGGAEKVLIDIVNNLDSSIFDITIIAIFKKSVYADYQHNFKDGFAPDVKYRWLIDNSNQVLYKLFNLAYNRFSKSQIYKWLVREKFDIEVAFYEGLPTEFVSHSSQRSAKVAWLHTDQAKLYEKMLPREVERKKKLYSNFQKIVGVSQAVCDSFEDVFGNQKAICLYNPLDDSFIRMKAQAKLEIPALENKAYLVTVGRLIPVKGYERLVNVLGRLRKEGFDFNFVFVGDGFLREKLEKLCKDQQLENHVIFLGYVDNPYPIINNAEVLICSSFVEGLGMSVMESLVLGVPILTTSCKGPEELIINGENGMICENSENGLYGAIKSIFINPEQLFAFKSKIREHHKQFTKENLMRPIKIFFTSLES